MTVKIAILGAGSWGATQAWLLAKAGNPVSMWMRDSQKAARISQTRLIEKPHQIQLPENIQVTANLAGALDKAEIVIFAVTTQSTREVANQAKIALAGLGNNGSPTFVSTSKGLELSTFRRVSEIISEVFPDSDVCALSGPNLAAEILAGLPTASAVASKNHDVAEYVQAKLTTSSFRLYTNEDVIGLELGGALKNIIAIASGSSDGLELGTNAKSTLLTRGLAEMTRFACALGAKPLTLSGLAGMGDLFATCSSSLSRNYRLGYHLARGDKLEAALAKLGAVAEGMPTCFAVCQLAETLDVNMPIAGQVKSVLSAEISPQQAILNLMARPLIKEH